MDACINEIEVAGLDARQWKGVSDGTAREGGTSTIHLTNPGTPGGESSPPWVCLHGQLGSLEGERGRRVGFAIANTPVNQTTAQHMAHLAAQANGAVAFRVALRDESAYDPLPVQWLLRLTLEPQGEGSLEPWTYVAKVDMHTPHDTVSVPLSSFGPQRRGRPVSGLPPLPPLHSLTHIGLEITRSSQPPPLCHSTDPLSYKLCLSQPITLHPHQPPRSRCTIS